jgi:hypothetical protein
MKIVRDWKKTKHQRAVFVTPESMQMEDIRPYRIRNEENVPRVEESEPRTDWELVPRERQSDDDVPFHIPRD